MTPWTVPRSFSGLNDGVGRRNNSSTSCGPGAGARAGAGAGAGLAWPLVERGGSWTRPSSPELNHMENNTAPVHCQGDSLFFHTAPNPGLAASAICFKWKKLVGGCRLVPSLAESQTCRPSAGKVKQHKRSNIEACLDVGFGYCLGFGVVFSSSAPLFFSANQGTSIIESFEGWVKLHRWGGGQSSCGYHSQPVPSDG